MATKMVNEPMFEADFQPSSYGFRPKSSATEALEAIRVAGNQGSSMQTLQATLTTSSEGY